VNITYTIDSLADLAAEYRRRATTNRESVKLAKTSRYVRDLTVEATLLESLARELEMTTIVPEEEK
jgi:hypothetical protein